MSEDLLEMSPCSPGLRVLAPSAPVSVLTRMLLSPTQPDVVIAAADGVTVATHAAVLAAASHKLRPLFAGAERGVFSLTVPRIPSSIWHHILSLLHTGAASVPDEATLISLIETAALLRMDELSDALKLTHARCQQDAAQGEGGLLDTKGQCSPSKTQHTSTCEGKVIEETSQANSDATARNTGKDSSGGIGGSSWNMPMPYAYSHKQEVVQKHQDETRENQVSLGNENYNRMTQEHTDSIARDMGPVASNVGGHNLWNAQMPSADQYKQTMGDKMSSGFYNGNSIDIGTIARDLDRASSNLDSIMAEVSTYSNVSKRQLWHLPPGTTSDPLQHHPDMVQGSQQLATSEYANRMEPMSFRQVLNQTEQVEDIKVETDEIGGGKDGQSVDIDVGRGNGNITDVRSVERSSWDGEKEEVTGYHGYIKQEKDAFKHKVAKNLVKKGIAVLHKQKQDIKSKIAAGKAKDTALTSDGLTSPEGAGDKSRRWIMDISDTCCHLCGHASVDQREAALHLLVAHGHKRCHRCKSCGSGYVSRRGLREHVNRSAVCGRHITYVGAVIPNPGKNPSMVNENVTQSSSSIGPNVTKPTVQKQPRKITKKRRRSGIRRSLEDILNQQAKPARVNRKPMPRTKKNFHCMDTTCIKCGNQSSSVKEAADHLRTKHGVQFPFVCRVCAKCYSTQPALTVHFKRVCWSQTDTNTHQGESVKNATESVDSNAYNTSVSSGDINTTAANNCRDGNKAEFNGTGVSAGFRSVNNRVFQGESVQTMTKCSDNNTTVSSEDRNNLLHDFLQGENDKNQTERNINNDKSVSLEYGMYLLQMSAANNEHRPHQSQSNKNTKEYNNNNSINTVSPRNRRQRIQKSTQAIIQERMIPSKCHICSYTNENLTEVLSHYAVVHSRDNCFNCITCGKIFRRSQDLYAHYSSKHRAVEKLTARNRVQHSTPNKVHQNGTAGIVNRVDQDSTQDTANKVQHQYSTESTASKVHQDSTQTTANKVHQYSTPYTANTVHQNNSQGTANEGRTRFSMKDMIDGVIDYSMEQAASKETCQNNVHTNTNEEYQEKTQSTLHEENPDPLQFSSPTYEGTEESMDYSLLPYEDHDNHFEADFPEDEDPADGQSDLHIVSISRVSSSPKKAAPITHLGSDVQ